MNKINYFTFIIAMLILTLFVSACTPPAATPLPASTPAPTPTTAPTLAPTTAPTTVTTPTPTPTQSALPNRAAIAISPTPTAAGPAAGLLAESGKNVYVKYCSKCHGEKGEGLFAPTVIGRGSNLGKYGSARGLMDYITVVMPYDAPGSLTQQEYLQVLSFLLIQNGFIKPETVIRPDQLQQIQLK